jgi:hypothetical protein
VTLTLSAWHTLSPARRSWAREVEMRRLWVVAACVLALGIMAAPAGAKTSPGLGGCRLIAASDDQSIVYGKDKDVDATTRATMASRALKLLAKADDPEIRQIVKHPTHGGFDGFGERIDAWCAAHYTQKQIDGL